MSSHHIVRDAQEPALLIANTNIPLESIGQLLEWSPVVVVLENCLEEVLIWDIKIDKILCQSTHYEKIKAASTHQQPLQIFPLNSTQISDYIHFAIKNLLKNGHDAISIVWEDFEPRDFEEYIEKVELIVYQENSKGYFLKKGVFKKWVMADTTFHFQDNEVVGSTNLKEIAPSIYQAIQSGLTSFEVSKAVFVREY